MFVDKSANMEMAKRIVLDAKIDYPAACNAMVIVDHSMFIYWDNDNISAYTFCVLLLRYMYFVFFQISPILLFEYIFRYSVKLLYIYA